MYLKEKKENFDSKRRNFISDVYLEGGDQFRGWFISSLIMSTITEENAPFARVLSHGFVVDEKGKKMSKSLNNGVEPQELLTEYGINVMRLWVFSSDYKKEIKISKNILDKVREGYQKIRNTFRFLLANLNYYSLSDISFEEKDLAYVDTYIISKANDLAEKCNFFYEEFEFAQIYSCLLNFFSKDLSSFFFDISKDCLYCDKLYSSSRKSKVSSLFYILMLSLEIISPFLPHLTEEVYENIPSELKDVNNISVHLLDNFERKIFSSERKYWITFMDETALPLRKDVNILLEDARKKIIENGLQSKILIFYLSSNFDVFEKFVKLVDLRDIFLVAEVEIYSCKDSSDFKKWMEINREKKFVFSEQKNWNIIVYKSSLNVCIRCKKYKELIENFSLCFRCSSSLS